MSHLSGLAAHQDVLKAPISDDPSRRTALISELKSRAKVCLTMKSGKLPQVAVKLYERAVEVAQHESGSNEDELKALYSNISMAYVMMSKYNEALEAANNCIDASDGKWAKGWFRKGRALSGLRKYAKAITAFEEGLDVAQTSADSKLFKKEIQKAQVAQDQYEKAKQIEEATEKLEKEKDRKRIETYAASKKSAKSKSATEGKESGKEADIGDNDGSLMKGYKKRADGSTTSYFDTERSARDLELIGDIAPKRISREEAKSQDSSTTNTGGSAWNQAGTFEEKDYSTWAKQHLSTLLKDLPEYESDFNRSDAHSIEVEKVTIGEVTACVIAGRKKKKNIWQFEGVKLFLNVHFLDEGKGQSEEATLTFHDVGSDEDIDDIEPEISFKKSVSEVRAVSVIKKNIKNYFEPRAKDCFRDFAESFRSK